MKNNIEEAFKYLEAQSYYNKWLQALTKPETNHLIDMLREYADQFKTDWTSVETLPERNQEVLIDRGRPFRITGFQRNGIFYSNETGDEIHNVIRWQPLPP